MRLSTILAIAASLVTLAGCGNKPPECADPVTIATIKDVLVSNANKSLSGDAKYADDPDGWLRKFFDGLKVEVSGIVSDGYKADAKKNLCRGTMKIATLTGKTAERPIEYSTQKTQDQKDGFLLEVQDFGIPIEAAADEARKYFSANRWTGNWNGTYACGGIDGLAEGPQGPYSMPATLVGQGTEATLERSTRGGGIEILKGTFEAVLGAEKFQIEGDGMNTPDDRWDTFFVGSVSANNLVAKGQVRVGGRTVRQCQLNLTLGAPVAASVSTASPATPAGASGFVGSYTGVGEGNVTVVVDKAGADGKYPIDVGTTTQGMAGPTCGGAISGFGTLAGASLKFVGERDGGRCEITMSAAPGGKLEVEEGQGCNFFHGAACGFSGTLAKLK